MEMRRSSMVACRGMPDDVATARRILALGVSGCMLVALPPTPAVAAVAPPPEESFGDPTAPPEPPAEEPGARAAIIPLVVEGELSASDRVQLTEELVEGLRRGAADGLRMLGAVVPALLVAALVEGFLSAEAAIPAVVRIAIGIGLGALFWVWLLAGGRQEPTAAPDA